MSTRTLPEHLLKLMKPEDRAALGKGGMTSAEAQARFAAGEEKKMHELFETDLKRRGIPYIHGRMDRKSCIRKGWPDFTVLWQGRGVAVEFKADGGVLSKDQETVLAELRGAGVPVLVAWNVGTALEFIRKELGL